MNRVILLYVFYAFLGLLISARLIQLQYFEKEKYCQLSYRNAHKTISQPSDYGKIYDRNQQVLVDTTPCYHLRLKPGQRERLDDVLTFLQEHQITYNVRTIKAQQEHFPLWEPLTLKKNLTAKEISSLSFFLHQHPYLELHLSYQRHYVAGPAFGLITGYQKEDLLKKTMIAHGGLEQSFYQTLAGQPSLYEVQKTARNKIKGLSKQSQGQKGEDLHLTLDKNLQHKGYELFNQFKANGALVALDCKTGEILSLISAPGFDAQKIHHEIALLLHDKNKPLFNRALYGLYPPASLLKPVIALAALEEEIIDLSTTIYDPGYYTLAKRRYKDWKSTGHGQVQVQKALRESCDTFFYDLGFKLGIDRMSPWLQKFGFGKSISSLGLSNKAGIVPSREWKKRVKNESWYQGESLITAIGQGYLGATPLQLAHMCQFFANKGFAYSPTILKKNLEISDPKKISEPIKISLKNPQHWQDIHQSLIEVIHHPQGTGHRRLKDFKNLKIAGKTGTAQVVSMKTLNTQKDHKLYHDHSLFMGYAPFDDPQVVLVVICEHQPHALAIAGRFFREVFQPQ